MIKRSKKKIEKISENVNDEEPKEFKSKILHIKMIDKSEIISHCIDTEDGYLLTNNPMIISEKEMNGSTSIVLHRYMPFSDQQMFWINKNHVMTIGDVNSEMEKYYWNSLKYNSIFTDDNILENIKSINEAYDRILNADRLAFAAKAKILKVDLSDLDDSKLN